MKKKLLGLLALASLSVVALVGCQQKKSEGDLFHIYAWNDEFKVFFEKYLSDEKVSSKTKDADGKDIANPAAPATYHLDGVPVKWTITPSDKGQYQDALDLALPGNAKASSDKKVDLFLAEADYIIKYADSKTTSDVKKVGVTDMTQAYNYTVQAASDAKGVVKGVSFQCCPSALIYNRVVARDVLGTDDPAQVQTKLSDWTKFDAVAAEAKAKGYYMTACEADTYRVFSNNATSKWVTDGQVTIPTEINQWMDQAKKYVDNGYTVASDVWGELKTKNIAADANKALCTFGPAWYYNFCMGGSKAGDWAICEGPMAHFWGGTWLMLPSGGDNDKLAAKVMNTFLNDEDVCNKMIKNEGQFVNNQRVNNAAAANPDNKNAFLGGQNDTALFVELAKNIQFKNATIYDQIANEGFQGYYREYLNGQVSKDKALQNFYDYMVTKFPNVTVPSSK